MPAMMTNRHGDQIRIGQIWLDDPRRTAIRSLRVDDFTDAGTSRRRRRVYVRLPASPTLEGFRIGVPRAGRWAAGVLRTDHVCAKVPTPCCPEQDSLKTT
jgi:hypothetical protein